MSISVLIVPILTQPELLDVMLASIDHPIDKVVVIDNGDVLDEGWLVLHPQYRVIQPGHNLGVAASWNLGMKATPLADYWLIVNHDIEFGLGDLARLEAMVEPRSSSVYFMLDMAAFAVTPPALQAAGWADENIVLAYDEDVDWYRRMTLAGVITHEVGFTGTHVGSATIHSDPALRVWNATSHPKNDAYYAKKWGGPKQGGETFDTPFGRGGDQGEWHLDINRLRDQTWPRSKKE